MWYNIEVLKNDSDLGVAQLVARYLGVVEAASSSLVTQTKTERSSVSKNAATAGKKVRTIASISYLGR